jgi:hypothetical protein
LVGGRDTEVLPLDYSLVDQVHVLGLASLTGLVGRLMLVIVLPTVDVLVGDDAVGLVVLVQHGQEGMARGCGFAMHGLLKFCIAASVVGEESTGGHGDEGETRVKECEGEDEGDDEIGYESIEGIEGEED